MAHALARNFICNVLILTLTWLARDSSAIDINWSCERNVTGLHFDAEKISGLWYEVARIPPAEVPACVEVTAPAEILDDKYTLHFNYVDNVNKQWKHVSENHSFPWDNSTQNGNFQFNYKDGPAEVEVIFKIVMTDYKTYAIVCGYSTFARGASLIKLMSRQRNTTEAMAHRVQGMADLYGVGLTWVDQSENQCCSGTQFALSSLLSLLVLGVYGLRRVIS